MDLIETMVTSVLLCVVLAIGTIDRYRHYAATHGYFLSKHRWARKIVCRAEELISPTADFSENSMEFFVSQYLERRVCSKYGDYAKRTRDLKEFYSEDSRILLMLLSISYQAMLFSGFSGTEAEIKSISEYQKVFNAAAMRLSEMGYSCSDEIERCNAMTEVVNAFCFEKGTFNLYK